MTEVITLLKEVVCKLDEIAKSSVNISGNNNIVQVGKNKTKTKTKRPITPPMINHKD